MPESSYIKLLYLRSRYYSFDTGRFITKDSVPGDYTRPQSLNGWNYVESNPINKVDPSGHCAENADEACWAVYEQIIRLCPQCAYMQRPVSTGYRQLHEESVGYLRTILQDLRSGWRPSGLSIDPLTEAQWNIVKQEATRFGIPKELLASTLAAEVVYDEDIINTAYDVSTAIFGAAADFAYINRDRPLFDICYQTLEGFHEYFGLAPLLEPRGIGYGSAPGIANMHAGVAVRVEDYINQNYPGQGLLPDLGSDNQRGIRLRTLLSDEGGIRYAAAYLRWYADLRKGTASAHTSDLTNIDMIIIYTGYRCSLENCYGSLQGFQSAQAPSPYGSPNDFAVFLDFYRRKP